MAAARCAQCGQPEADAGSTLLRCSRCKTTFYCTPGACDTLPNPRPLRFLPALVLALVASRCPRVAADEKEELRRRTRILWATLNAPTTLHMFAYLTHSLGAAVTCAEHQQQHWPQHRATCSAVPQASATCAPMTVAHPGVDVAAACDSLGRMELGAAGDEGRVASSTGGAASPLRVCMIAPGSRGDVMPLVAVGAQLKQLGCRCATPVPQGFPPIML